MLTRREWCWTVAVVIGLNVVNLNANWALARPKPVDVEAVKRLQELRKERIRANEKGNASEFAGKWKMRLPAGFEYTVEFQQTDTGLLRLTCPGHALVLLGTLPVRRTKCGS